MSNVPNSRSFSKCLRNASKICFFLTLLALFRPPGADCASKCHELTGEVFSCRVGGCIELVKRCDGIYDCPDRSDEQNCPHLHCNGDESLFECRHGLRCIGRSFVCDYINDCGDWSDEITCTYPFSQSVNVTCPEGEWGCSDGFCIPSRWKCDGYAECPDASDEAFCDESSSNPVPDLTTTSDSSNSGSPEAESCGFRCGRADDKEVGCIPLRWLCDGENDCTNGEDESPDNCDTKIIVGNSSYYESSFFANESIECAPHSGWFDCQITADRSTKTGGQQRSCLHWTLVCDGTKQCANGHDENHCDVCSNSSVCESHPNTKCMPSPLQDGTVVCFCAPGYETDESSGTCADVDECQNNTLTGVCSHICSNSDGSYECSCLDGYNLVGHNVPSSCVADNVDPLLIFSTKHEVRGLYLKSERYSSFGEKGEQLIGVSFDNLNNHVLWSSLEFGNEVILGSMNGNPQTIVSTGLKSPEDLAVDSLSHKLYFTDSFLKQIVACDLARLYAGDNNVCVIVVSGSDLEKPRALSLHPRRALMFFSDWGTNPHITRAGMDGTNVMKIVTSDVVWPNGVVVDTTIDRVFWSDAKLTKIESMDLDGGRRVVITSEEIHHPFSLAVFEDTLFWSDWETMDIQTCNKFTGKNHTILIPSSPRVIPMGIHIQHPLMQGTNPCKDKCSQICLLSPSQPAGYSCQCPKGWTKLSVGDVCFPPEPSSILPLKDTASFVSVENRVYMRSPVDIGKSPFDNREVFNSGSGGDISSMAYDDDNGLFISSVAEKRIVMIDLKSGQRLMDMTGRHIGQPESLALHLMTNNLYWTDSEANAIKVMSTMTGSIKSLLEDLSKPMGIAIINSLNKLIFTEIRINPAIKVVDLSGNGYVKSFSTLASKLKEPIALTVDESNPEVIGIYIADRITGVIYYLDYHQEQSWRFRQRISRPTSIIMAGARSVCWSEEHGHSMFCGHKNKLARDDRIYQLSTLVRRSNPPSSIHLAGGNFQLPQGFNNTTTAACVDSGCAHLCFQDKSATNGYVCSCSDGYTLVDLKQCVLECGIDSFACDMSNDGGQCVSSRWICDGTNDCDNGQDEIGCGEAEEQARDHLFTGCYSEAEWKCKSNDYCIQKRWICDRHPDCEDGSDEHDCNVTAVGTDPVCQSHQKLCGDGLQCIPSVWWCDDDYDCNDGTDEESCDRAQWEDSSPNMLDLKISSSSVISPDVDNDDDDGRGNGTLYVILILSIGSILLVFSLIGLLVFRRVRPAFDLFAFDKKTHGLSKTSFDTSSVSFSTTSSSCVMVGQGKEESEVMGRSEQDKLCFDNPTYDSDRYMQPNVSRRYGRERRGVITVVERLKRKAFSGSRESKSFGNPLDGDNEEDSEEMVSGATEDYSSDYRDESLVSSVADDSDRVALIS